MEKIIIINEPEQLNELVFYIENNEYLAVDCETDGLGKEARIIGFSISPNEDIGYYVVLSYWDNDSKTMKDLETKEYAQDIIKLFIGKKLIMHNAIFDCFVINNNYKIDLMPYLHTDTMILAHVINENKKCGLKELGAYYFGEDAKKEMLEMRSSVVKNGGSLTKKKYELFKADPMVLATYGAKDTILTYKLFNRLLLALVESDELTEFYYQAESIPLLKGPTYDLNTVGLKIDPQKLQQLQKTLEAECQEDKAFIYNEIMVFVKDKYPGTSPKNTFNIDAPIQMSWLLFNQLANLFGGLTKEGLELCKFLSLKPPYSISDKRTFLKEVQRLKGTEWIPEVSAKNRAKARKPKKIKDYWHYLAAGKESLERLSSKYEFVKRLLRYKKNNKLLNTYVLGIQNRMSYNIIRPSFLQHGTTSGRYSSRDPNFQNLPRDDKRIKQCIISRPGKVFVGADYSQLEPRVFASLSGDYDLLKCFESGEDFYSVIGAAVFSKPECTLVKDDSPNSFAKKYPLERQVAKTIALAVTYGTTPNKLSLITGKNTDECRDIIDRYFMAFPGVENLMKASHEIAKEKGIVYNLYGRPRRIPEATEITEICGDTEHNRLPYYYRTLLNLAVNHRVQSTAASIMNRSAIAVWNACKQLAKDDEIWYEVKIVMQCHDELVLEGPKELAETMVVLLRDCMENTVILPGIKLVAEPKIAYNLGDLK